MLGPKLKVVRAILAGLALFLFAPIAEAGITDQSLTFAGWRQGRPMLLEESGDGQGDRRQRYLTLQSDGRLKSFAWAWKDSVPAWPMGETWQGDSSGKSGQLGPLKLNASVQMDSLHFEALAQSVVAYNQGLEDENQSTQGKSSLPFPKAKATLVARLTRPSDDRLSGSLRRKVLLRPHAGEAGYDLDKPRFECAWLSPDGRHALLAWHLNGAPYFIALELKP